MWTIGLRTWVDHTEMQSQMRRYSRSGGKQASSLPALVTHTMAAIGRLQLTKIEGLRLTTTMHLLT